MAFVLSEVQVLIFGRRRNGVSLFLQIKRRIFPNGKVEKKRKRRRRLEDWKRRREMRLRQGGHGVAQGRKVL